jgi:hypothetical protein
MAKLPLESDVQKYIIDRLGEMLPGCYVLKNDSSYWQGIPDLLVVWQDRWAMLEVKRHINEGYEPNQEYHIDVLNRMSFCAMICPENMEEVLDALQSAFRRRRLPRLSVG